MKTMIKHIWVIALIAATLFAFSGLTVDTTYFITGTSRLEKRPVGAHKKKTAGKTACIAELRKEKL